MNTQLLGLKPERLWYYFAQILEIPRPSKKEERIVEYLLNFGKEQGLETLRDEVGNVLIRKPAMPGMEKKKMVVLQSHVDMVCEKNNDVDFDFDHDPIQARIDGEWVKATGTTLGADDGIGVAAQLALLESKDIKHGPIECLFTIDEETGLTGAFGLKPGFLKSTILLNLDSEDDGELFIGCAGGRDTVVEMGYRTEEVPPSYSLLQLTVSGLLGGHSGDDISKGRGNAVKIINRMLWHGTAHFGLRLANFKGGNLRNAIAREAVAQFAIPAASEHSFRDYVAQFTARVKAEYKITEPGLEIACDTTSEIALIMDVKNQQKLLNALYACPHGVIAWSAEIPNFVETSTNLASVMFTDTKVVITTSQRSSVESAKDDICNMVASVFHLAGASVKHTDGYPGWKPNPNSMIVDLTSKLYKELFDEEPKVLAIHAGLECGLIGDVYPEMDMISYGPTIKGAHSPDERLLISTVEKFWDLTVKVLEEIPEEG